jgi:RNA polymerase sigma-70 factor (ECF subfamily)
MQQLWDEHYGPLAAYCAALVKDRDLGHDIAAEAFTRMFARWFQVRDPRGFLYVVATNLAHDHWRQQQRDRWLVERIKNSLTVPAPVADLGLRDVVDRLPERLRAPVLLHYYADMTVAQIAAACRRPEGTIKRSLHEARVALRQELTAT